MKKFRVFAYNDNDDKMEVYASASLEEAVSVAVALYRASDLEFRIFDSEAKSLNLVVSFIKSHD